MDSWKKWYGEQYESLGQRLDFEVINIQALVGAMAYIKLSRQNVEMTS